MLHVFQNNSAPTQGECIAFQMLAALVQPRITLSAPNWLLTFRQKTMHGAFGHAMQSAIYLFLEDILQNCVGLNVFFLIQVYCSSEAIRHAIKIVTGAGSR